MKVDLLNSGHHQRGATILEFSICAILFFGLVGAGVDFGYGIWRYANLTFQMNSTVRTLTIDFARSNGETCTSLEDQANDEGEKAAKKSYLSGSVAKNKKLKDDPLAGDISFLSEIQPKPGDPAGTIPKITVITQMKFQCFFCIFIPKNFIVATTAQGLIENPNFSCV